MKPITVYMYTYAFTNFVTKKLPTAAQILLDEPCRDKVEKVVRIIFIPAEFSVVAQSFREFSLGLMATAHSEKIVCGS